MERKDILETIQLLFEEIEEKTKYPKEHNSKLNIILEELNNQLRLQFAIYGYYIHST